MTYYTTPGDRPTRQELADEPPLTALPPQERANLVAELAALQAHITRCSQHHCRTTVDLDNDPAALCDSCGEVVCDWCDHTCAGGAA